MTGSLANRARCHHGRVEPDPHQADLVEQTMRLVAREDFLPPDQRALAGRDGPLPLGDGQTCSQPRTVAAMLRLLEVAEGHRVLDVGAGSGWTTALLARLVGPSGTVVGVELLGRLARWAADNVAAQGTGWARVVEAESGVLGMPALGPYDRVLVSAEARELPHALVDQMASGALMVTPVAGEMWRVRRAADGTVEVSRHGAYRFVPLR